MSTTAHRPPSPILDQAATLVRASDDDLLGGDIALLADYGDTAGALTCHRSTFRAGAGGAPPHFHARSSELFYMLSGSLEVLIGDDLVVLHERDLLVIPPRLPHAFAATSEEDAEVLCVLTGGVARFDYYRLLDRLQRGEADPKDLLESQERFDNYYVPSATWEARGQGAGTR